MDLRSIIDSAIPCPINHGVLTEPHITDIRLAYVIAEMQKIETHGGDIPRYVGLIAEKNRLSTSYGAISLLGRTVGPS